MLDQIQCGYGCYATGAPTDSIVYLRRLNNRQHRGQDREREESAPLRCHPGPSTPRSRARRSCRVRRLLAQSGRAVRARAKGSSRSVTGSTNHRGARPARSGAASRRRLRSRCVGANRPGQPQSGATQGGKGGESTHIWMVMGIESTPSPLPGSPSNRGSSRRFSLQLNPPLLAPLTALPVLPSPGRTKRCVSRDADVVSVGRRAESGEPSHPRGESRRGLGPGGLAPVSRRARSLRRDWRALTMRGRRASGPSEASARRRRDGQGAERAKGGRLTGGEEREGVEARERDAKDDVPARVARRDEEDAARDGRDSRLCTGRRCAVSREAKSVDRRARTYESVVGDDGAHDAVDEALGRVKLAPHLVEVVRCRRVTRQ